MSFKGVCTALITPFTKDDEVDYKGLEKNIEFQIDSGVDGILLNGTTAETPTLTAKEQEEVIRHVVSLAKGKTHIMVGTGTNSTFATVEKTKRAQALGADSALIVTPYYNKPTQEGIYRHFKAISEEVELPIYIYNIPGRTAQNINLETFARLTKLPNVCGVKESSGDLHQAASIASVLLKDKAFSILSGDDFLALPIISLGGSGLISVLSNAVPSLVVSLVKAALESDLKRAQKLHYQLLPLMNAAFIETNPIGIKHIMEQLGLASGSLRLPLCEMKEENKKVVNEVVRNFL